MLPLLIFGQVQLVSYICATQGTLLMRNGLQSRCLQALYLPVDHTAKNIRDALAITLQNWNSDPLKQV